MQTSDIGFCAALAAHDIHPLSTTTKAGLIAWTFRDDDRVRELRQRYFSGALEGNLLRYNAALRMFQGQLKGGR